MRHNLTNVAETQLDKVDSFYVVGSTTKEGLIEGRSNVKIDLKKAVAGGGDTPSEGGSLSESIAKVLNLDNMEYYGRPDMVVLDTGDGIIDGRGVHSEALSEEVMIGNIVYSRAFIIEDETRWKSFDSLTTDDFSSDDSNFCTGAYFAYSLSKVQQKTPADTNPLSAAISKYIFPFTQDDEPRVFNAEYDAALYKYNNEYYVIFVSYG